jgi:hypothetical protein
MGWAMYFRDFSGLEKLPLVLDGFFNLLEAVKDKGLCRFECHSFCIQEENRHICKNFFRMQSNWVTL